MSSQQFIEKANSCELFVSPNKALHIQLKTYNGETALVIVHGMVSGSDCGLFIKWVKMLRSNDYVNIVLDLSKAHYGDGALDTLKVLEQMGIRLIL